MKTRGSLLLERTGKSRAEIARAAEVDPSTATLWITGKRKPQLPARQKLLKLFNIPVESWEQATGAKSPKVPSQPAGRSQGSVLLARISLPLRDIAEALGVSERRVKGWSCGDSIPGASTRAKIAQSLRIPADTWFVDAREVAAVTVTGETTPVDSQSLLADVPAIRKEVQELMKLMREDGNAVPLERAKVLASCATTISILGKLTGEFDNNRNFLKLPFYKRLKRAMDRALKGYPEAALALGRELRQMGDTQVAESES